MSLRATLACLLAISAPCTASAAAGQHDYVVGYAGWFDIARQRDQAAQFGVEYRFSSVYYGLRPTIGANITTDGSFYGYGGVNWEIELMPNQLYVIPNFMAGGYAKGDGRNLGGPIEFRSGIELAYQFPSQQRVGVAFNHISNASIYDRNPGAETLLINYSLPF